MDLQRPNVKFFVENQQGVPLTTFIDIFNSWIQDSNGEYYDLADYSHMNAGPGIVLVADEANISIDNSGNRWGLIYSHKRPLAGNNRDKLHFVFKAALENCKRIEEEPLLRGQVKFLGSQALFLINDRLVAPNTEETFAALKPELEGFLRGLYGGTGFFFRRSETDPRQRFSVEITADGQFAAERLLRNLVQN